MNKIMEQPDAIGKKINQRKFLAKAQYNLRISRDELDQKRTSLSNSFDSRKRDNSKHRLSTEPAAETSYSTFQNNTMDKTVYKNKEKPKRKAQGYSIKVHEDFAQNERRMSFGNNSAEENIDDTKNWLFEGTGSHGFHIQAPFSSTAGTHNIMRMQENKETEYSTNFDVDQAILENKFREILEREKKNIFERSAFQIAQLEEKMKEKYNSVAKEVLECKLKQSQTKPYHGSPIKPKLSVDPQTQQIKKIIASKKLLDISVHSEKPTSFIEDRSFLHNTTYLLNEINHIKQEFHQDDNPFNLSRLTTFGDFEQKPIQNSNVKVCKKLENELEQENNKGTSLLRKVEELESDKKELEKKLYFLEGILASGGFIGNDQANIKQNGDRFKTPKAKEFSISILNSNTKEIKDLEGTRGKDKFFLEVSDIHLTPQKTEDAYVNELKEQIKQLSQQVESLDKRNAELTEKNRTLNNMVQQNKEEKEEEMENSQIKQSQTVKFWKQKCEVLVSKYFTVIKRLKDDNDKLREKLMIDYKKIKRDTSMISSNSQPNQNKMRERSENKLSQQPLDERSHNREGNKGVRSRSIRG